MHDYDKSTKWLIQHHGDAILRLAGVRDFAAWTPLQAEPVLARRLPDDFIEVRHVGETEPDHYVVEVASFPDARVTIRSSTTRPWSASTAAFSPRWSSSSSTPREMSKPPVWPTCAAAGVVPACRSPLAGHLEHPFGTVLLTSELNRARCPSPSPGW
ncbi:MAG: hypothetical protein ACHRXM_04650 [Isosphaerales bacterium]